MYELWSGVLISIARTATLVSFLNFLLYQFPSIIYSFSMRTWFGSSFQYGLYHQFFSELLEIFYTVTNYQYFWSYFLLSGPDYISKASFYLFCLVLDTHSPYKQHDPTICATSVSSTAALFHYNHNCRQTNYTFFDVFHQGFRKILQWIARCRLFATWSIRWFLSFFVELSGYIELRSLVRRCAALNHVPGNGHWLSCFRCPRA